MLELHPCSAQSNSTPLQFSWGEDAASQREQNDAMCIDPLIAHLSHGCTCYVTRLISMEHQLGRTLTSKV